MKFRDALRKRLAEATNVGDAFQDGLDADAVISLLAEDLGQLRPDVKLLLHELEKAEAALDDLLGSGLDINGGINSGKSWSEYQVEDGAVNDAHRALASLRAVLDGEISEEK